jgi:ankyrin repeat protein
MAVEDVSLTTLMRTIAAGDGEAASRMLVQVETVRMLLARGADVRAANRRGAQPLHYAADGRPGSRTWNAGAQAETVACLIESGADPNAVDRSGVTPLHRAVRTRCGPAVRALLEAGADARRLNKSGSSPMQLALSPTGRGGAVEPPAKAQQREIIDLLQRHGGRGPNTR